LHAHGAGGLPQLPSQQLPGGVNLQQLFLQHSQEQQGSSLKLSWTPSKAEKKNYDSIFRAWDTSGSGFISGQTALEVFGQSGLDKNDLAKIWYGDVLFPGDIPDSASTGGLLTLTTEVNSTSQSFMSPWA
jgi:hypothetical protein